MYAADTICVQHDYDTPGSFFLFFFFFNILLLVEVKEGQREKETERQRESEKRHVHGVGKICFRILVRAPKNKKKKKTKKNKSQDRKSYKSFSVLLLFCCGGFALCIRIKLVENLNFFILFESGGF